MKNIENKGRASSQRSVLTALLLLAISVVTSGCYLQAAQRDFARDGEAPWWCKGDGGSIPALTLQECNAFSLRMDVAVLRAQEYPTLGQAQTAGASIIAAQPAGIGVAVNRPGGPTEFNPAEPNVLLYNGNSADSRVAGVAWRIEGEDPSVLPAEDESGGFAGDRDQWISTVDGAWWLPAWVVRGYQNHANIFAPTQPCLEAGVIPSSTTDQCFKDAHPEAFKILVTNDDGYSSEGIGYLVDGLQGLYNVDVRVVAPLNEQSGSSDQVTESPYTLFVDGGVDGRLTTLPSDPNNPAAGWPATAVGSTDTRPRNEGGRNGSGSPADTVLYALLELNLSPEFVISGINDGQNYVQTIADISGTVGAARTARLKGVPSLATSQGGENNGVHPDFPTGVAQTLAVLEEWRLGIRQTGVGTVLSINIPSCSSGSVRDGDGDAGNGITPIDTLVAPNFNGGSYNLQDCTSVEPAGNISSDLEAFNNGFVPITDVTTSKAS